MRLRRVADILPTRLERASTMLPIRPRRSPNAPLPRPCHAFDAFPTRAFPTRLRGDSGLARDGRSPLLLPPSSSRFPRGRSSDGALRRLQTAVRSLERSRSSCLLFSLGWKNDVSREALGMKRADVSRETSGVGMTRRSRAIDLGHRARRRARRGGRARNRARPLPVFRLASLGAAASSVLVCSMSATAPISSSPRAARRRACSAGTS